jgi:hypothetical protein
MIRFIAFSATGRAEFVPGENVRAENLKSSALPSSHSCRRSGRSAALPYPPHELDYSSTQGGGWFFDIKMDDFLRLKLIH